MGTPANDCKMQIWSASAAIAKFGFHGVFAFDFGRWDNKAATPHSICSAASINGCQSELLMSTMPKSSTNGCYQLCRGCCAWSVLVWQINCDPKRGNSTVFPSRVTRHETLPEEERKKCRSQSASSKIRQNATTGSMVSVISIRKVAGTTLVSPNGVVAVT